jgi:hypothetical protein
VYQILDLKEKWILTQVNIFFAFLSAVLFVSSINENCLKDWVLPLVWRGQKKIVAHCKKIELSIQIKHINCTRPYFLQNIWQCSKNGTRQYICNNFCFKNFAGERITLNHLKYLHCYWSVKHKIFTSVGNCEHLELISRTGEILVVTDINHL